MTLVWNPFPFPHRQGNGRAFGMSITFWILFPIGEAMAEPLGRTLAWILFPISKAMAEFLR